MQSQRVNECYTLSRAEFDTLKSQGRLRKGHIYYIEDENDRIEIPSASQANNSERRKSFKRDFGALGLGASSTTTDTAAWLAAIAYLTDGGLLEIEDGTYNISQGASILRTTPSYLLLATPGIRIQGANRVSTKLVYTGTSGALLSLEGTCSDSSGTGLIHDIQIDSLHLVGTGENSGNTDSGIYIKAFQFVTLSNLMVESFGQDGIHLDRDYYTQAPNPTLDDRGLAAELDKVQARFCGRYGIHLGGTYSVDHVVTKQCYTSGCGVGIYAYTQGWTDISSVLSGRTDGCIVRQSSNANFPNHSINFIGTRFEESATNSNITIEQGNNFNFVGCNFISNVDNNEPSTGIKLGTLALTYNVEFTACRFYGHVVAIEIGQFLQTMVRIIDPIWITIGTKVVNTNSKPCIIVEGKNWIRVDGGGPLQNITGSGSSNAWSATKEGDAQAFFQIDTLNRRLLLGRGTSSVDVSLYASAADTLRTADKFIADAGLGVGNSAAATTLGSVTHKMEVFDSSGASLGFIPIYDSIT